MTFQEALATQEAWIRIWVLWMGGAILVALVVLAFSKTTRGDALIILLTNLGVFGAMELLYQQVGFVRLLGLVHVVFWTPLALYLWWRLKNAEISSPYRQVMWVLLVTILVSLAFDYADVVRYALGERASMVK